MGRRESRLGRLVGAGPIGQALLEAGETRKGQTASNVTFRSRAGFEMTPCNWPTILFKAGKIFSQTLAMLGASAQSILRANQLWLGHVPKPKLGLHMFNWRLNLWRCWIFGVWSYIKAGLRGFSSTLADGNQVSTKVGHADKLWLSCG
jgi:hypothetical protein